MTSLTKNQPPPNQKIFFRVQTTRFAASFDTSTRSVTLEITCHDRSIIACHMYMGVFLCAHLVHGELHIQCNANGEVATVATGILFKIYHSINQTLDLKTVSINFLMHELKSRYLFIGSNHFCSLPLPTSGISPELHVSYLQQGIAAYMDTIQVGFYRHLQLFVRSTPSWQKMIFVYCFVGSV